MRLQFASPLARSRSYRPDIDGLRALAVLGVLIFHLSPFNLPGGYVGVDVFFVISGYLITSIIVRDLDSGNFSFAVFYERRMRRILPPLLAVLTVCILVAAIVLAPADLSTFGRSLSAATGFLSNRWFAFHSTNEGYFGNPSATQVLLHTWSLSVEEQFYLLFPVFLWVLHKFGWRNRTTLFLLAFTASFLLSLHDVSVRQAKAFYLLQDRGWEFLLGAAPVLIAFPELRQRIVREAVGFAGLGLILYAACVFDEATPFPGLHALLPCGGALLFIYSGKHGNTVVRAIFSFQPVVFLGVISYSIYLWHWPLIAFWRYFQLDMWLTSTAQWTIALLSVLLAFLSFQWIEAPVREKRVLRGRVPLYAAGVCGSLGLCAAGWMCVASHGLVRRYPEAMRETLWANQRRRDDLPEPDQCSNVHRTIRQRSDMAFCTIGPPSRKVLFWGDSHVEQFLPLFQKLERENTFPGQGLIFAIAPGCPPSVSLKSLVWGYDCVPITQYTLERAQKDDIETVFIQLLPWWTAAINRFCLLQNGKCTRTARPEEVAQRTGEDLLREILLLKSRGKRVILGFSFPCYDASVPDYLLHQATFRGKIFSRQLRERDYSLFRKIEENIARKTGVETFDPRLALCPMGACIYEHNGVSIYRDESHFGASQIDIMRDPLVQAVNRATPSPAESDATHGVRQSRNGS